MSSSLILSGIFLVLSIVVIFVCFIGFRKKPYSRYLGASACIYCSACLFIFLIGVLKDSVPLLFFILADILATFVFLLTCVSIVLLCSKVLISAQENKEKTVSETVLSEKEK